MDRRRSRAMSSWRRTTPRRDDSGQALILAMIFVFLVAALVPLVATSVIAQGHEVSIATTSDTALAAAEAGVQEYRNYLDNVPGYYTFTNAAPPPASEGRAAMTGWQTIAGTSPQEAFHYIPNATRLQATSGGSQGQMLLEVTGRAGNAANSYAYRSIMVSFQLSGILTDSYYSEYEISDLNEPGTLPQVTVTQPGNGPVTEAMNSVEVSYTYTPASGPTINVQNEALDVALCKYHTFDENTFVDSLGSIPNPWSNSGNAPANATNPYYGPYYDSSFSYTYPAGSTDQPPGTTVTIAGSPRGACDNFGVGIYDGGVTFAGVAYTNDQFWLCGDPTFDGSPPLVSGAPVNFAFGDQWRGSTSKVVGGKTVYVPLGYVDDFHDGCGGSPVYGATSTPKTPELGGSQHLPPTDLGLLQYASGLTGKGCLYTGPTMIEFVSGGTMNVWSPLTKNTEPAATGTPASCGTFSPSSPWQTGVALPPDGVVYVQSVPGSSTDPNYWASLPTIGSGAGEVASGSGTALPSGATCINPYYATNSANSPQCSEGDAMVEGELRGQVTLATAGAVIVTRDLTYECADGAGGPASAADPSSVAACNQSGQNDVLGLLSNSQLIVAHPLDSGNNLVGDCSDDGTPATVGPSPGIADVTPTCDIQNATIDAAAVTLQGSTYVPGFQFGGCLGNLYQNGTNINYYPGFNGTSGCGSGYEQQLSYDTRLSYLQPPHILQATDSVWDETSFVVCGTVNTQPLSSIDCPALP